MLELTDLEVVALSEIAKQHPALIPQIAAATVLERENTGVGFFTRLAVDRAAAAAIVSDRVLGDVWLDIEGFLYPMTFMVFMEDGFVSCLEGATVGEETDRIELSSLRSEGPTTMGHIVVDAAPEREQRVDIGFAHLLPPPSPRSPSGHQTGAASRGGFRVGLASD